MKKFLFFVASVATACVMLCGCSSSKMSSGVESNEAIVVAVKGGLFAFSSLDRELHSAVRDNNLTAVKAALEAGADPNAMEMFSTPIFNAKTPEIIGLLIEYGADVDFQGSGLTPLIWNCMAASDEHIAERAKVLLEAGANPNARGWLGTSAMHHCKDANTVKLLIDYGGDVNAQDENGITPLREFICQRRFDLIQLLLEAGADPDLRDKTGKSSREYALERKCCEFEQGSMIKIEDPTREATEKLLQSILDDNIEAIKTALAEGADPNGVDLKTPFLNISAQYSHEGTKLLLDAGADPNATSDGGVTPLHVTVFSGNVETAKLLLEAGADPNICDDFSGTPVFSAYQPEMVCLLKEHGGNVNFVLEETPYIVKGTTPLMYRVQNAVDHPEHIKVLSALLKAGANPDARDAEGKSAKDYANERGIERIKKLFR